MSLVQWNRELEQNRQMVEGILAMLISFAAMAARLPGLPLAVRRELLIPLRHAEASIRDFIVAKLHDSGPPLPREVWLALSMSAADHPGGEDERLTLSFRALALVLAAMLAQAKRFGHALAANQFPRNVHITARSRTPDVAAVPQRCAAAALASRSAGWPHFRILAPP